MEALYWACWLEDCSSNLTWPEFHKQLLRCYTGEMITNPYEFLTATKQSSSIDEYSREFEMRAAQIKGLTYELYLGLFLNGLREKIRVQIFQKEATDVFQTMDLAREVEHRLLVEK